MKFLIYFTKNKIADIFYDLYLKSYNKFLEMCSLDERVLKIVEEKKKEIFI